MKIEILRKKKEFKKGGFHANPNIGWELVVFSAIAVTIAFFIFGLYLFMGINKEFEAPVLQDETREKIIEKEKIQRALIYFSERAEKSSEILSTPAQVVDPSL